MKKSGKDKQKIKVNDIKLASEEIISQSRDKSPSDEDKFYIVGVGASAGGLEALEQFLGNVSEYSGMAYIIIQHLDPTHKDIMPELLQRITTMEVYVGSSNLKVKPNCVYMIPPNKSMSILKGMLHLSEPIETRGLRLPVDFLFQSLAEDQKDRSIGIILSGMGSDGTQGLQAIKEKGGITVVQDPKSAKFDSMPRSAMNDVQVDIVGEANELPIKISTFIQNILISKSSKKLEIKDKKALNKIINLIRTNVGHDFYLYKENTMYRRIQRRMIVHKYDNINTYAQFLEENIKEIEILYKELLIGVTSFFRDPLIWEQLEKNIIPTLLNNLEYGHVLRAWIPACSTGEEAYSLAMVFKEVVAVVCPQLGIKLQIFATDLDLKAIDHARKGFFQKNIVADVSQKRLDRFFEKVGNNYRINNEIREMVVFAQQNVIMDPPFTKLDILSCRNLLIYMENELQNKLMSLFHYSINPGGFLILGSAETISNSNDKFKQVEDKLKIYQRLVSGEKDNLIDFPASYSKGKYNYGVRTKPVETENDMKTLTEQLILQQFSPASVLVNENGDIIYINGKTGNYLEPSIGKANWNIFVMLREGLRNEFPSAFRMALKQIEPVVMNKIIACNNDEPNYNVNISIKRIETPMALRGMVMVVFTEVYTNDKKKILNKTKGKNSIDIQHMEQELELERVREEMQIIFEEMQTSQEELKSANEELQSTNEELQSANEELTTSKEEMQSLNEELQTVNVELESRLDDYLLITSDMKNLLNSADIATLFLDKTLNIRRFTKQVVNLFKILDGDIGRPITDLTTDLIDLELVDDAMNVLQTLVSIEKNIPTRDGRWFIIRVMPYRTFDDRIDGIVITFIDITKRKLAEEGYMNTQLLLESSIESFKDMMILSVDTDYNYLYFNQAYKEFMKTEFSSDVKVGMVFNKYSESENDLHKFRFDFDRALAGETHSLNWYYGKEQRTYYETLYKPIYNRNDEIIGATAFAINIALRQYEEETYKLTEDLLKKTIENSQAEIAITNTPL